MARLTGTRHVLFVGAAIALANFPALAASGVPPDVTLVCVVHPTDQLRNSTHISVEVWFDPGKVVLGHTQVYSAKIDDRAIIFEGDSFIGPNKFHHVGIIDRATDSYSLVDTPTVPGRFVSQTVGHCLKAPSKPLF